MRRDEALAILRAHEAELRARGVVRLRLFGSVARDEATEGSDVDVLVDFDPGRKLTLFLVGGVYELLVRVLGMNVDLVRETKLLAGFRDRILSEALAAF